MPADERPLLKICNLDVRLNAKPVLKHINLSICNGQITSIVGPNGAGKTTLMKAVAGVLRPVSGAITFRGIPIHTLPVHAIVRCGLVYVPEGMGVFPDMSVRENLEIGAYCARAETDARMDFVSGIFPVLADKRSRLAKTLSGGQKRMLVIGRALMSGARLLLLDDPFLGLAPRDVRRLCDTLKQIRRKGITLFLAGQHVRRILQVATRAFLIEDGRITLSGSGHQLLGHPHLRRCLYGIATQSPGALLAEAGFPQSAGTGLGPRPLFPQSERD